MVIALLDISLFFVWVHIPLKEASALFNNFYFQFSSVQLLSSVQLFAAPCTAPRQVSLFITNSKSLLKLMSIESVMPFNHLILCCFLLLLPSVFPRIRVFSNESALYIRWPKCWSFSFNISPSSEYSGLISFMMDWLDLLEDQGTLKSLLQHHSPKASILQHSAFFIVQLSHPYMTPGKFIALTRWTFVGKVMSLLFSMLSRLVITFLPRSKRLSISWLQSPSAVILEPPKIKSVTVSTVSPSISHEVIVPDAMILVFWMLSFKPTFSLSFSTFIKRLFSSSSLSAISMVSSDISPGNFLLWLTDKNACPRVSLEELMSVCILRKGGDILRQKVCHFIWAEKSCLVHITRPFCPSRNISVSLLKAILFLYSFSLCNHYVTEWKGKG